MHARELFAGDGEHSERIVLAKVILYRERKPRDVGQVPYVVGMNAGGFKSRLVERDVVVRVAQHGS